MWVSEMTVGMRPSFTSYWAYTNKSQIIPLCGVRGILPADVCPAQNSPVADFCLSVSVHSNTPPSNSIQTPYTLYIHATKAVTGAAAELAATRKITKYDHILDSHHACNLFPLLSKNCLLPTSYM